MLYKTLYKKKNTDKIIKWSIFYDLVSYWTEYGLLDGKMTTPKPTFVYGKNIGKKNETSVDEQIRRDMDSIIKYKIDADGYVEDINDVHVVSDKLAPMLANKYNLYNDNMKFIQPKLDGIRCFINIDGNYSRKFNVFSTIQHIEEELNTLFRIYPSITFDGELYSVELFDNFNKIVSLVKRNKPTEEEYKEIVDNIKYHVYDMFDANNPDMIYSERFELLHKIIKNFKYIKIVQTEPISCQEDVTKWFDYFTSIGYEGAIIRTDEKYEHRRSSNLLKLKDFRDFEYEILDIVKGEGNREEMAGKFIMKDNFSPQTFKAAITGTFDYCKELLLKKDKIIGKLATIKYFALTPKVILNGEVKGGVPRFGTVIAIRDYE